MQCSRIGPQHQAGSDSLLTLACYFKMLEKTDLFGQVQFSSCLNVIFGIGLGFIKTNVGGFSNTRDYQESNSYLARDYNYSEYSNNQHEYYERNTQQQQGQQGQGQNHPVYMSQLHPYMQSVPNAYQGPLYQYLHHQQQPPLYQNYMYQNQEHPNNPNQQQQKRY